MAVRQTLEWKGVEVDDHADGPSLARSSSSSSSPFWVRKAPGAAVEMDEAAEDGAGLLPGRDGRPGGGTTRGERRRRALATDVGRSDRQVRRGTTCWRPGQGCCRETGGRSEV